MEKGRIRFIVALVVVIALAGSLFGVLFHEQKKRIATAELNRKSFVEEQQAVEQARKQYFDSVAAKRTDLRASMSESKQQYEQLLKNQQDAITQSQTTTTQTVTVPVKTVVSTPVVVTKPTATRKTKTS